MRKIGFPRPAMTIAHCLCALASLLHVPQPVWADQPGNGLPLRVVFTADTEGHVGACTQCPSHTGLGGLSRRATLLRNNDVDLLLDAGNALFGEESLESDGKVMVAAYELMRYDAINISFRDFRLGKGATLNLLEKSPIAAISANLVDERTGQPLFKPMMIKQIRGQSVAVIGVTEAPVGIELLPHLKRQLAGVRIQSPVDALKLHISAAKAEAKEIVLLYYGSSSGLRAIREKYPTEFSAILVGGLRTDELPTDWTFPVVATEEHGKSLGLLTLSHGANPSAHSLQITSLPITPDITADPAMQHLLQEYSANANR
jgi:2',3'-cyclic-nucleotide 2'-phosphodiesterase (5'-nucleotidase family)